MNRKTIVLIAFVLMVLVQLYVPGKMIWDNERIWLRGTTHHFKTAPVDPTDIFRGKYIDLNYEGDIIKVDDENDWSMGEEVFGVLAIDREGFSYISSLVKEEPERDKEYLKLTVRYVPDYGHNEVHVNFPFDRFYMEESIAFQAELSYNESRRDTTSITYALVSILDGESVIKDVLIDGVSIKEVARSMLENAEENTDP